jgi:hypothetical protein
MKTEWHAPDIRIDGVSDSNGSDITIVHLATANLYTQQLFLVRITQGSIFDHEGPGHDWLWIDVWGPAGWRPILDYANPATEMDDPVGDAISNAMAMLG